MLCYFYKENGFGNIAGKHVYGSMLGKPPTFYLYNEFLSNKDYLVEAPYSKKYIEQKTNKKNFPYNAYFKLSYIKNIDYRTLQKIASFLETNALLPRVRLIYSVRNALKDL